MISNENRYAEEYFVIHGSALEGSDPHELAAGFEVCQMKGTHIGTSELTLFKCYEIGLLRIHLTTVLLNHKVKFKI